MQRLQVVVEACLTLVNEVQLGTRLELTHPIMMRALRGLDETKDVLAGVIDKLSLSSCFRTPVDVRMPVRRPELP